MDPCIPQLHCYCIHICRWTPLSGCMNFVPAGSSRCTAQGTRTKTSQKVQQELQTGARVDGEFGPRRRHLNIRGKSANLPAITDKDWADIKFGVDVGVDYYALSFVRNADIIYELKRYLSKQGGSHSNKHSTVYIYHGMI